MRIRLDPSPIQNRWTTTPLVSLSSSALCDAFEETFRSLGPPKHLITDRGGDSGLFADFLKSFEVKQRF
jgi:hypothetical protein